MVDSLKKKARYTYITTALIIILGTLFIFLLLLKEKNAGTIINIAGKQRTIIQRLALLSNNYFYDLNKNETKKKLLQQIEELKLNQKYLKALNSNIVNNILYGYGYQYDNLLNQYTNIIENFLNKPTNKLLKIINYTDEALLTTADTLVILLAKENDKNIDTLVYLLITIPALILLIIYFIYKKVTLISIDRISNYISELDQQKSFMSTILDNSAHAVIATDPKGTITLFNKSAEEMLGYSENDVLFKQTPALFHKPDEVISMAKQLSKEFNTHVQPGFGVFVEKTNRGLPNKDEWTYVRKDSSEIIVRLSITKLVNSQNVLTGYIGIAEDITTLKHNETSLKEHLRLINTNIITSSTDLNGKITYASEAFCNISGYTKEEMLGKNHNIVRHPDMPKELYEDLWKHILKDKVWNGEIKNLKKDGTFYWVKATISPRYDFNGNKIGYTAIRQDITDRKLVEVISVTDGLTDIFNRRHFDATFSQILQTNIRNKEHINFLMMDVDHFKQYNDTYGHQMGDNVLIEIAKSLKQLLKRQDDLCFRLGGEEFGVVFYAENTDEALAYAHKIKQSIEDLKIEHSKNSAGKYVTVSMGLICLKSSQNVNADMIYSEADKLLYQAKELGRNKIVTKEMQ